MSQIKRFLFFFFLLLVFSVVVLEEENVNAISIGATCELGQCESGTNNQGIGYQSTCEGATLFSNRYLSRM